MTVPLLIKVLLFWKSQVSSISLVQRHWSMLCYLFYLLETSQLLQNEAKKNMFPLFPARLYQHLLWQHLPYLPYPYLGTAADLCHLPVSDGDGTCQIPRREGCKICGTAPRLSPICQPWQEERGAVVDLPAEFGLQSWIWFSVPLYSVPDLSWIWPTQVRLGSLWKYMKMERVRQSNYWISIFICSALFF